MTSITLRAFITSRTAHARGVPTWLSVTQCRYHGTKASASQTENPLSDAKSKPKSSTPLRRSASASLPIRANPTPTRGDIQPIFTVATAERYVLSRLRSHTELPARSQALHEAWWVPKWGAEGKEGEIFVFSNGTVVCWGLGESGANRFVKEIIHRAPGIEVAPLKEPETEELDFVVDPIELSGACSALFQDLTQKYTFCFRLKADEAAG